MVESGLIVTTIMSPRAVLWHGEALSITAQNNDGVFDILPDHARFLTVVSGEQIVVVTKDGVEHPFMFASAVLFFADNNAKIYTHEPVNFAL